MQECQEMQARRTLSAWVGWGGVRGHDDIYGLIVDGREMAE